MVRKHLYTIRPAPPVSIIPNVHTVGSPDSGGLGQLRGRFLGVGRGGGAGLCCWRVWGVQTTSERNGVGSMKILAGIRPDHLARYGRFSTKLPSVTRTRPVPRPWPHRRPPVVCVCVSYAIGQPTNPDKHTDQAKPNNHTLPRNGRTNLLHEVGRRRGDALALDADAREAEQPKQ